MKLKLKAGTTSKIMRVRLQNSSGVDVAGLTWTSVSGAFCREGDTTDYPLVFSSGNIGVWSSGGFISIDDTSLPGIYEIGLPNHLIQTGYKSVVIMVRSASTASNVSEIELDNIDYQTSIPNAVWDEATASHNTPGTFGESFSLNSIYYADAELIYDVRNNQDEYGVQWFKNGNPLSSGQVTNQAFSVVNGNDGTFLLSNRRLGYVNTTTGLMSLTEPTSLTTSGVPYLVIVSGTIDSATRTWSNVLGKE